MINYTLSQDATLTLLPGPLQRGYVKLTIYHNNIGVFTGRAYNDGSPIRVSLNDIVLQNHGKNDYLKLNMSGELTDSPMEPVDDEEVIYSRFKLGQVSNYRVTIMDDNNQYVTKDANILAGYDYVNKDIRTTFIVNDSDSELGRLMQGTNWIVQHDNDRGDFQNRLLPHLPNKITKKIGFGVHLGNEVKTRSYAVRTAQGNEVSLGLAQHDSDMMLLTPAYLYWNGVSWTSTEDNTIFLKYQGTSGDEFGDWQEGTIWNKGHLSVDSILATGTKNGQTRDIGTYAYSTPEYAQYVEQYIDAATVDWNLDELTAGHTEVYTTEWNSYRRVDDELDVYEDNYGPYAIQLTPAQAQLYDSISITPIYTRDIDERQDPDKYIGKCPICILDACYSRYYLAWMDRYGDIMSQPFDGKVEFSEDITKDEIMDYKQKRRVYHNEIQPKWKLNTKWIPESLYPMYEAIFTSPYLLLYDTETDRSWNVILTDTNYKEKTYKTEKTLINIELSVEANTKQYMIY